MKFKQLFSVCLILALLLGLRTNTLNGNNVVKAAGYGLSNPTISSDGVTTWDCIYFGNYWQNDTNGDGKADENDDKEPIKWRVLSVDGDDAFLLADKCLREAHYNDEGGEVDWEDSSIRKYLNSTFMQDAFTEKEQEKIKLTEISPGINSYYKTEGGNKTKDYVYLLSEEEATNSNYGFDSNCGNSNTRVAKVTKFGGKKRTVSLGNLYWWLRTKGESKCRAEYVVGWNDAGFINQMGRFLHREDNLFINPFGIEHITIRPALHLDLSSTQWKHAGKIFADGNIIDYNATNGSITVNTPKKNTITDWDLFRDYPEYLFMDGYTGLMDQISGECETVNTKKLQSTGFWSAYKNMLMDGGMSTIIKEDFSRLFGTESVKDEYVDDSVKKLLQEVCSPDSKVYQNIVKEVKTNYKWCKEAFNSYESITNADLENYLINDVGWDKKEIDYMFKELSKEGNWKKIKTTLKAAKYTVKVAEIVTLICYLEDTQKMLLDTLIEEIHEIDPDGIFEQGLLRARERTKYPHLYVASKYINSGVMDYFGDELEDSIAEIITGMSNSNVLFCAKLVTKTVAYLIPVTSADKTIEAAYDFQILRDLERALLCKVKYFINCKKENKTGEIEKEISKYEFLFNCVIAEQKISCDSAQSIAKGKMKNILGNDILLLDQITYEDHIKACKALVVSALNAKYSYTKKEGELGISGYCASSNSSLKLVAYKGEFSELDNTDDDTDNKICYIPSETEGIKVTCVEKEAFCNNDEMEVLIIDDGIEEIKDYAFANCENLKKVILGKDVKKIGDDFDIIRLKLVQAA